MCICILRHVFNSLIGSPRIWRRDTTETIISSSSTTIKLTWLTDDRDSYIYYISNNRTIAIKWTFQKLDTICNNYPSLLTDVVIQEDFQSSKMQYTISVRWLYQRCLLIIYVLCKSHKITFHLHDNEDIHTSGNSRYIPDGVYPRCLVFINFYYRMLPLNRRFKTDLFSQFIVLQHM